MEQKTVVLIVGAGPSGLATAACLNARGVSNVVLEREYCCASLWKKRGYDHLKLNLAKEFRQLPYMPFPSHESASLSNNDFTDYLNDYASAFLVNPLCSRLVKSATFDISDNKWLLVAENTLDMTIEIYRAAFLVVATGENIRAAIPDIPGLDSFPGVTMHSSRFENGKEFINKDVLVVASWNSGMDIAYDLANWGANTSIVTRYLVHVLKKEIVQLAMHLFKFYPVYGIQMPRKGPFRTPHSTGRFPIINVDTDTKGGKIIVLPGIKEIDGNHVEFSNGKRKEFDAIVFNTGFKGTVRRWLKDEERLFDKYGMPKKKKPNHWKGEDGLYCAGFSRLGLLGISKDAMLIAEDINTILKEESEV